MAMVPPEECPVCGADVPRSAQACPECGASEGSGWGPESVYDGTDLPDDEFNYEAFVRREFDPARARLPTRRLWWITALVAAGALLFLTVLHHFI